jgi:GT2 family glycosyltransferase
VAKGAYLCFLDDDAKPPPAYLASIHQVIEEHRPDIFGGPVYPYYTTPKPAWFDDALEIRRHAPTTGFSDGSISGGNFVIRTPLLRELGMFSPELGMVGKKVRLGEERAILEKYRSRVPRAEQRVFYSLECFIYHHVPPAKMRVWYFIKRGYFSGKANVLIKHEHPSKVPWLLRKLMRAWFLEIPRRLRTGASGSEHPVLALQSGALLAGKIAQHIENIVGLLGTETAALIRT